MFIFSKLQAQVKNENESQDFKMDLVYSFEVIWFQIWFDFLLDLEGHEIWELETVTTYGKVQYKFLHNPLSYTLTSHQQSVDIFQCKFCASCTLLIENACGVSHVA